MLYDVFICHASEDKDNLVRPLAKALKKQNVEVWYDEFELKPGDSLRESIDRGLAQSRVGVVVISKAFFAKKWTKRELGGLTALQMCDEAERRIIPIWHGVTVKEVVTFSPPLGDIFALSSRVGVRQLCRRIILTIRPQESPLVVARDELIAFGIKPPVISDEWWLDVVEASNKISCAGGAIHENSSWGRWTFPLPNSESHGEARGIRLAWTAMQMKWEAEAENQKITQLTNPKKVMAFIDQMPGLEDACMEFPHWLATYAPQVTIQGYGGKFEAAFSELEKDRGGKSYLFMRFLSKDNDAANDACQFVQGELFGPTCKAFNIFDYLIWFFSKESEWLPQNIHQHLLKGMLEWGTWLSFDSGGLNEQFIDWLLECKKGEAPGALPDYADKSLLRLISASIDAVGLSESADVLKERFLQSRAMEIYVNIEEVRNVRRKRKQII